MKDLLERLRSPQNLFEQQRAEAELSGLMSDRERGFSRELELIEAKARIAELERERDGGVGYGLTPDDLDRPPYNLERKEQKE